MGVIMRYRKDLIDFNFGNWRDFRLAEMRTPEFITIHNTAEPFSAEQERMRVQNRADGLHTCFHYAVDGMGVLQILPLNCVSYHAGDGEHGDGNTKSLSVEICYSACYGDAELNYRRSEIVAIELCAWLVRKFDIPEERFRRHFDWSGKCCPHRIMAEGRWRDFVAQVYAKDVKKVELSDMQDIDGGDSPAEPLSLTATVCSDFRGNEYSSVDDLAHALRGRAVTDVIGSSWDLNLDVNRVLSCFAASGISTAALYVPVKGENEWLRKNVIQSDDQFAHYRDSILTMNCVPSKC